MSNSKAASSILAEFYRVIALIAAAYTVIIASSLIWNIVNERHQTRELAIHSARSHLNKDQAARFWASSHGGVYVPVDGRTRPNPYLSHIAERDVTTPSGKHLTLINPSSMIRQIMNQHRDLFGVAGRITSLDVLNPENTPDEWERVSLKYFERGAKEAFEFATIGGEPYLRLMRPIIMEEKCLKCHGDRGYKVGDIRGGVGVSVPMNSFLNQEQKIIRTMIASHGFFWLLGLSVIGFGSNRGKHRILERKRAEDELRHAHADLQRAYDDLAQAQTTALRSEKLAAVGRLTAGVSHEILNPLNAITLSLHLMIENEKTPPELVEDLSEAMDQTRRITKISQDLLFFSRQRPPERTVVDIEEVVERTVGLLAHELRLGNISMEMKFAENLPKVWADQDQLQQVILNLLTNARDALPNGGLLVIRASEAPPLLKSESSSLELRAEDSGPGIDPEQMDKIFEPFFTTKEEGKGTGMGLSICHGIVESHGGAIWAENLPQGGAAFIIRLPLGQAERAQLNEVE